MLTSACLDGLSALLGQGLAYLVYCCVPGSSMLEVLPYDCEQWDLMGQVESIGSWNLKLLRRKVKKRPLESWH